jgi:hypothetical protein
VKSGCVSRELKTPISRKSRVFKGSPLQKTGIRKSKTSRWRAAALILLNLFMIAHIIQWRIMGISSARLSSIPAAKCLPNV